jgi:hypothetical protein
MLLGHRSIRTTVRYTRVTSRLVAKTKSPVDVLGTPKQKMIGSRAARARPPAAGGAREG